jgi:hypothetical protein
MPAESSGKESSIIDQISAHEHWERKKSYTWNLRGSKSHVSDLKTAVCPSLQKGPEQ